MTRPTPRTLGYLAAWVGAAAVAVAVGLFAVTGVGASVRDRGPLLTSGQIGQDAVVSPNPSAPRNRATFAGDYGEFVVACQGAVAFGESARPASGWRTIAYEQGPDDDVDAVFASGRRSIELEVYCDAGEPTQSDLEDKTLPDDAEDSDEAGD